MAKPYVISIVSGTGSSDIATDEYTVTAVAAGYDTSSISPSTITITDEADYAFTIAATGTLTLHVSDDGTEAGTPIVGATFVRCDADGTPYGDPIPSDDSGNAVFNYVPYSDGGDAPIIYYKQTASDGEHDFATTLYNVTLSSEAGTEEIFNPPPSLKNINLTDAHYEGLPIAEAEITLS